VITARTFTSIRTGVAAAARQRRRRTHSRTATRAQGVRDVGGGGHRPPENTPAQPARVGCTVGARGGRAPERRPPATATGHTVGAIHHRPCGLYQRNYYHLSRALPFR